MIEHSRIVLPTATGIRIQKYTRIIQNADTRVKIIVYPVLVEMKLDDWSRQKAVQNPLLYYDFCVRRSSLW